MKITLSKHAGFCKGVQLAYNKACLAAKSTKKPIYIFGDLVHNKDVVKNLERLNIKIVHSLNKVKKGTLIITAHGISPKIREQIMKKNLKLIDTTCPFGVIQVHNHAKKLEKAGKNVILIGKKNHPEVRGIIGELEKPIVISDLDEVRKLKLVSNVPIAVISQTTFKISKFKKIVQALKKRFSNIKIIDTICRATHERQEDIKKLASKNNIAIIIGDPKSSNSTELYNTAKEVNPNSYFISDVKGLKISWFKNCQSAAITASASTPSWIISQVISKIKTLRTL